MAGEEQAPEARPTLASSQARQFLAPLRVDPTVHGVAGALIERARSEPELAKLFMAIQGELGDGRDILDARQSEILDRIQVSDELDLPSAPNWIRPAIVTAYLRAKDNLTPQVAARIMADPNKALRRSLAVARSFEPDFIGELIIETTLAQRDTAMAARLHTAADELRRIIADLYVDAPAHAIAQAAGGGGGCLVCRGGHCEPISCWVVVAVLVVVVVTK